MIENVMRENFSGLLWAVCNFIKLNRLYKTQITDENLQLVN